MTPGETASSAETDTVDAATATLVQAEVRDATDRPGSPVIPTVVELSAPTRSARLFKPITPLTASPIAAVILVGLLGNLALRTGMVSVASALTVAVAAIVLMRHGMIVSRWGRLLALAAVLTALWLPLRSSPWLAPLNVMTSAGLLIGAVTVGRFDVWTFHPHHAGALARRAARLGRGPELLVRSSTSLIRTGAANKGGGIFEGSGKAVLRGLLLALIPLVPIVALLASADVVFASLLRTPGASVTEGMGSLMAHAVLTLVVAAMAAGLFAVGLGPEPKGADSYRRPLGSTEATVVLIGLVVVFTTFAITQVLTAAGGASHVIETANLTRADYAREGFFQLLAVSVITLGVLFGTRIFVNTDNRRANFRLTVLATMASLLTVVIVGVSLARLSLYVDAYGLTMLRLYSMLFGVLIGTIFVLYVGHLLAPVARLWFVPAVSLVAWALLMGLNVSNPEARVSAWNISHQTTIFEFDAPYATGLSSDTIPALVNRLDELPGEERQTVVNRLCRRSFDASSGWGPLGWNHSHAQAETALATLACP